MTNEEITRRLSGTTDASVWAKTFVEQFFGDGVGFGLDEGLMLGWFANAIEAGRTAGRQEFCPHASVFEYDELRICNICGKRLSEPRVDSVDDAVRTALDLNRRLYGDE